MISKRPFRFLLVFLCCFLVCPQAAWSAKRVGSSIAILGGYNLKSPGSAKNIVFAARVTAPLGNRVFLGGEGGLHLINKSLIVTQGKLMLGVYLGTKRALPYVAANVSYNVLGTKQANGTILANFDVGAGAHLGCLLMLGKSSRVGFLFEANVDYIITSSPKYKFFGGLAGFVFRF